MNEFMEQFTIRICLDCGLAHAPDLTCEEAEIFFGVIKP